MKYYRRSFIISIAILFFFAQTSYAESKNKEVESENTENTYSGSLIESLFIYPIYHQYSSAGSDTGGLEQEYRSLNKAWTNHYGGLDISMEKYDRIFGFRFLVGGELSYNRSNKNRLYIEGRLFPAVASLYYNGEKRKCNDRSDEQCTADYVFNRPVYSSNKSADSSSARLGISYFQLDPEGFLFNGYTGGLLFQTLRKIPYLGCNGCRLHGGIYYLYAGREKYLYDEDPGSNRLGGFIFGINAPILKLDILSAYYTFSGWEKKNEIMIPTGTNYQYTLQKGEPGIPSLNVIYYGARTSAQLERFSFIFHGIFQDGKEEEVSSNPYIVKEEKEIRGFLGFFQASYGLGPSLSIHESHPYTSRGLNYSREIKMAYKHTGSFSFLSTSRDVDDQDNVNSGFSGIRPSPGIMGGYSSILITGPSPNTETLAFDNKQDGISPFHKDTPLIEERFQNNNDTDPPDYTNDGMKIYSFAYTYIHNDWVFSGILNKADLHKSHGYEAIALFTKKISLGTGEILIFASATGLRLKQQKYRINPFDNTVIKSESIYLYYSRYLAGFTVTY